MLKNFLNIFFIILILILQISFFSSFVYLSSFNLILCFLIFYCVIISYEKSLFLAAIFGMLLNIFTSHSFGIILFSFVLTLLLVNFLFHALFTNKSLYTLVALNTIGTISFNLLIIIFNYLAYFMKLTNLNIIIDSDYLIRIVIQIVSGIVFLSLLFFIYSSISKKLKSVFLLSD